MDIYKLFGRRKETIGKATDTGGNPVSEKNDAFSAQPKKAAPQNNPRSEQDDSIWEPMSEEEAMLRLRNDFELKFKFQSYRKLKSDADKDNVVLDIFEKKYISCKCFKTSIEGEPVNVNRTFEITYSKDIHDKNVVSLTVYPPIFDSGDSMYDRWHSLFLISDYHKSGNITGVYAKGGMCGVASLAVFENMTEVDSKIMEYLEKPQFFLKKGKIRFQ